MHPYMQALSRLLLCCDGPMHLRRAASARLAWWRAKLTEAMARGDPAALQGHYYGGYAGEGQPKTEALDAMNRVRARVMAHGRLHRATGCLMTAAVSKCISPHKLYEG